MKNLRANPVLAILAIVVLVTSGCSYSFTGASVSPEVKTVQIDFFPNQASLVQPSLSQTFTEKLRDRFVSQTSLELVTSGGDLIFEGAITNYFSRPLAIQGNEQAALNRLTITVKVKYSNRNKPEDDFDSAFTRYADFSANQNLASVELDLIGQICDQLVNDIFNKSVVNW
jgi:outer membrane lipopolysaccharide assembly protein LptE/RlpB